MDPVSPVASIIAVLSLSEAVLSSCYRFVGKVKDAASDIDRLIRQIGYLTTVLQDLAALAEPGGTESAPSSSSSLKSLAGENGPLAVCAKSLEELKAKLPSGPVSFRKKLEWPFKSTKINEIMDRIMGQVPILELAVAGDNLGVTKQIQDSLEDSKRRNEREKVLDWLRCADPTVKHLESRRLHQDGSNNWVLESAEFKEWHRSPGQTFWLHGIPGAGKTSKWSRRYLVTVTLRRPIKLFARQSSTTSSAIARPIPRAVDSLTTTLTLATRAPKISTFSSAV